MNTQKQKARVEIGIMVFTVVAVGIAAHSVAAAAATFGLMLFFGALVAEVVEAIKGSTPVA